MGYDAIGVLCAYSEKPRYISGKQIKLIEAFANRVAWAVNNVKTYGDVRGDLMRDIPDFLSSLGISKLPTDIEDMDQIRREFCRSGARKAKDITDARSANVRILENKKRQIRFAGTAGDGWSGEEMFTVYELWDYAAGPYTIRSRKPYRIDDIDAQRKDIHYRPLFPWAKSHLSVPLMSRGRAIGVVSCDSDVTYAFSEEHEETLSHLAQDIVKALDYADSLEDVNLHNLEEMASQAKDVGELCTIAVTEICSLISAEAGSIFILDRLVEASRRTHIHALIVTAIHTGMRKSELFNLRWSDVNFESRKVTIQPNEDWSTKNYKYRTIAMTPFLYEVLRKHRMQHMEMGFRSPYVFTYNGQELRSNIKRSFSGVLRAAGLKTKGPDKVTLHTLRHTFASQLVMAGVSLREVQVLMGHQSYETTLQYAHMSEDHANRQVLKLPFANGSGNFRTRIGHAKPFLADNLQKERTL